MTTTLFTNLIGTLAVILLLASYIGGSSLVSRFSGEEHSYKDALFAGLLGGVFGIYGNLSGIPLGGAIVSVRDIGPMLAGLMGGPLGGLSAGVIAGVHRYTMGGITAEACIIATVCIGTFCGILGRSSRGNLFRPGIAFLIGAAMEAFHLGMVLLMVRPFSDALALVETIALPFILVNAAGFALMIYIMVSIENRKKLELERNRLQSELEVATVIQRSLLPPISDKYPGREEFEVAACMEPAKEVGGDFYDIFFVGPDKAAFLVADVSGKGIPAALFMATAKLTLQNCIRDFSSLSEAVQAANNTLCASNEAGMFVTAWIGILEMSTGKVTFVCAGHNPPALLGSEGWKYLRCRSGLVLAGMEDVKYRESEFTLQAGDTLLLYTDGVTEAENAAHSLFGEARLMQCLDQMVGASASEVIDRVRKNMDAYVNGFDQFDDITMLCLKMH